MAKEKEEQVDYKALFEQQLKINEDLTKRVLRDAKEESIFQRDVKKDEKIVTPAESVELQKKGEAIVVAMFNDAKGQRVHKVKFTPKEG